MDGIDNQNMIYKKGERIGQYEIIEVLEPTRFGHTYLGQRMYQSAQATIEVFQPPLVDELKENFLAQARALIGLGHPHILRMRDTGLQNHYPFLIADYISHPAFRQRYPQGSAQPLVWFLPYLKQIASALRYAHTRQMLHGDIRPENILLAGSNNILLRGFLIETIMENRERLKYHQERMISRTIPYTAPERIQGKAGPASDQYSLGILVYELLSGGLPFTGTSIEVAHQQIHAPAPAFRQKVPGISGGIEKVVMKALEKDPGQRFSDIEAFVSALEQEQQEQPVAQIIVNRAPAPPDQPTGVIVLPIMPDQPTGVIAPLVVPAQPVRPVAPQGQGFARATPAFQPPNPAFQPVAPPPEPPVYVPPLVSAPAAPRRGTSKVTRRTFAAGLVGLAVAGGAGGWYLVSQRLAASLSPAAALNTLPLAIHTTVENRRVLVFPGHQAGVNALTWSPDGKLIASASDDTSVQIFDASSGSRKIIYTGHTQEVAAVSWSANGKLIASGGQDRTVQIWNATTGAKLLTYKEHKDRVNGLSWSSDSRLIASGSDDKSVQVWSASNAEVSFKFLGHTAGVLCVGWQPDDSSVASGSWDGTLRDWATVQHGDHFDAGDQIFNYDGHGKNEVYALAWSPNSAFIASAGADQTVQLSNGDDGTPRPPFFTGHENTRHVNPVLSVAWSPDGTSVASGDSDGNVYVWKTTGRKTFFIYHGHKAAVNAVAWSPDGKTLASASADKTVQVWQPG